MPAAALVVGQLALGIGLVFLRPLAAQFDDRAHDRVSVQSVERDAHHVHQHVDLARRVRLGRALERAFELELTC